MGQFLDSTGYAGATPASPGGTPTSTDAKKATISPISLITTPVGSAASASGGMRVHLHRNGCRAMVDPPPSLHLAPLDVYSS